MKEFTTAEIRDLLNRVYREEISFSEMVEVLNYRMGKINESQYKDGDFVVNVCGVVIIFKNKDGNCIYDHAYFNELDRVISFSNLPTLSPIERYATEEEKQRMLDVLEKKGKRWNEEKKCIEDIPKFKNGDFVVGFGCVFILHTQIDEYSAQYHVLYAKTNWNLYYYRTYSLLGNTDKLRLATEAEKQELLDALAKKGKRWNAEKLCIEDIPQRKFKPGDKVKLKDGMLDKREDEPYFGEEMDVFIGKVLTVKSYTPRGNIFMYGAGYWMFAEDWLEPYVEKLKKGDLAIFWDKVKRLAIITFYERLDEDETCLRHKDIAGSGWENAIKFESKEQFERFINGEI